MRQKWFKSGGCIYLPVHPLGFVITILALVFMIPICMELFITDYVADNLYEIFVYGTCTAFWWK